MIFRLFRKNTPEKKGQDTTKKVNKNGVEMAAWNGVPPKIALHSGEGRPGQSHLDMWLPVLMKSGIPLCVITRVHSLFDYCNQKYPEVPLFYASTATALEKVLAMLGALKLVVYPSHTGNNIHSLRFNHLTHVFIGHGDSEKSSSAHKFFRAYDEVWVAGQAHIDRFTRAPFETRHMRFEKIGRPQLSDVIRACSGPWNERFTPPAAFYLPTWEGLYSKQAYSSLPMAEGIAGAVTEVLGGFLRYKPHPMTGFSDPAYTALDKQLCNHPRVQYFPKEIPIAHVLPHANIFICDISAVITECLATGAPIFVYQPESSQCDIAGSDMPIEEFTYCYRTPEELQKQIIDLLENGDRLSEQRHVATEYYFGRAETEKDTFISILHAETE